MPIPSNPPWSIVVGLISTHPTTTSMISFTPMSSRRILSAATSTLLLLFLIVPETLAWQQAPIFSSSSSAIIRPARQLRIQNVGFPSIVTHKRNVVSSSLLMSTANEQDSTNVTSTESTSLLSPSMEFDGTALMRYAAALAVQMSLFGGIFYGLDQWVLPALPIARVPLALNALVFYFVALKSRVLNPLSNQRPLPKTLEIDESTKRNNMPSWTPPGVVFPIVWLLIIGPLRAITSAIIIQASGGRYCTKALLSLMLHLSIGDIWNTINNVERRLGTSVVGVSAVWMSAAHAAWQYSRVHSLAGRLLSIKLIWLTIASALIIRTWQLNPPMEADDGRLEPLWPRKMVGQPSPTQWMWFSNKK